MNTISDTIKKYNNKNIHNYYLLGDDIFLEKFFINQISKKFLSESGSKKLYHFSVDNEDFFLNDLQSNSLFDSKKIIVCWEINKLSKKAQKDFLAYLNGNPSEDISLLIIAPDFRIKNNFLRELSASISTVDVRTPFPNKMKNWVKYYAKSNRFSITNELVDFYVECYGDSLSNVVDQIDKHRIYSLNPKLDISDEYSEYLDNDRKYNYWQFLDSIGQKKLVNSFQIFHSMIENNVSQNYILSGLSNLFFNIYAKNIYLDVGADFPIINKILLRNLDRYCSSYSAEESLSVLKDLYEIDKMVKSFKYGVNYKIELLILKVCYEQKK